MRCFVDAWTGPGPRSKPLESRLIEPLGAARESIGVRHQLRAFQGRRRASGRVGNRIEQSRGIERSNVLENADPGRMFKSSRNGALHGALKCEIGVS